MAPVEDTTGHWDHYLPTLDDIYSSSPAFLMPNQATSSLTPSSRDPSGYRGGMSSIRGSSALLHSKSLDENFYDKYGASGYASSSSSTSGSTRRQQSIPFSSWSFPTNDPSTRPIASSSKSGGIIDSPEVPKHVGFKSQSPLACHPTLSRDLPPADSDIDYMDHDTALYHHSSPSSSEDILSPLHLYQSWQGNKLPLNPLQEDIYHSGMMYPGKLGPLHDLQDMPSVVENDEDYHPDHLCAPLFWLSPGSIDTDLDDESSMSSSTSSLSPEYQDSELRHSSTESEEEEEYDDERYFAHSSPPMCHDNDRYHQLEQYPSHFDLYHPIHSPVNDNDEALPPLSLSPPHGDRLPSESPLLQLAPLPPASPDDDKRALGLPPFSKPIPFFPSLYHFDDESTTVPCSPSRRRSTDLPSLDGDPFDLQEGSSSQSDVSTASDPPQRAFWLSLPGADTDDDLIPRELGSKNYVPDPTIAVPTTPPSSSSDGLLLLDLDANDLPPPRSPSPENFQLDPSVLAELAGDETGEEAQKLYDLRQRTTKRESWERERLRELSALLRLKLKLDERGTLSSGNANGNAGIVKADGSSNHPPSQALPSGTAQRPASDLTSIPAATATVPITPPTDQQISPLPLDSSGSSWSEALPPTERTSPPRSSSTPTPSTIWTTPVLPRSSSSPGSGIPPPPTVIRNCQKPKIKSIDQLVANMVFHRQQEALRRKPARSRTWSPPALGAPVGSKSYPTPRSPLRQMSLPEDMDEEEGADEEEDGGNVLAQLTESPLPLSPLYLMDAELSPLQSSNDLL